MKRGLKADLLEEVLNFLVQEKELPVRYRDHQLTDSKHFQGVRECHIQPDWLLVYEMGILGNMPEDNQLSLFDDLF